jgi:hypothetical protein
MGFSDEDEILRKLGLDFEILNSGCCGMAGSFGFEADHYDISKAIGERALLPAVREADVETLVIADGFSCREQIAGLTGRGALHLAQVLQMAMREGPQGPSGSYPEEHYEPLGKWIPEPSITTAAAIMGMGVLTGLGAAFLIHRTRPRQSRIPVKSRGFRTASHLRV